MKNSSPGVNGRTKKSLPGSISLLIILFFMLIPHGIFAQTTEKIDFKWLYFKGDPEGAENTGFDDGEWEIVRLPHDASLYAPPGDKVGWYRKHIELFGNLGRRKIYIEFEGVLGSYEFWVNDRKLGKVRNGLKDTIFDLTPFMHIGENIIALRYDTSVLSDQSAKGEGLYRSVWIHFNNELHLAHEGASYRWQEGPENSDTLHITTTVLNHRNDASFCRISMSVSDPAEKSVWKGSDSIMVPSGSSFPFEFDIKLPKPVVWSPDQPLEYAAVTKIEDRDGVVDVHEETFCLRTLEPGPSGSVILNGDTLEIKAVHYDPEPGPLGMAQHERALDRNLRTIKRMGFNAINADPVFNSRYLEAWCESFGLLILPGMDNIWDMNDLMDRCGFLTQQGESLMMADNPGNNVTSHDNPTVKANQIILNPDRRAIGADGFDLSFITVRIADRNGGFSHESGKVVKFRIKGAAGIAGVGNGDPSKVEPSQSAEIKLYDGKALLILRSNQRKGAIEIKASGRGLKPATIVIEAI